MSPRRGDLLWQAQYGPSDERRAARDELRRLDEAGLQQQEAAIQEQAEEAQRATARQIMGVPDPVDPPPRPSAKQKGDAAWDLYYRHRLPSGD